jgi:predicted GNAT superfamily acetyltransferase
MYGITDSVLHGGIPTDRLVVAWPTRDQEIDERLVEAERVLASADCRQSPVATEEWIAGAAGAAILPHCIRIEIPADAESMLLDTPADAVRWRDTARRGMQWGLTAGYSVSAFYLDDHSEHGYYLMTKTARPSPTTVNGRP